MEKAIRVLVANRPRLMRETILTTFADQPDIEIVGEVDDDSEIVESVKKNTAEFRGHSARPTREKATHPATISFASIRRCASSLCHHRTTTSLLLGLSRYSFEHIEPSEEGMLSALRNKLVASETN